jgi:hypothetical protein
VIVSYGNIHAIVETGFSRGLHQHKPRTIIDMKRAPSTLEYDQGPKKATKNHRAVLCFGDTSLHVDAVDFSFLETLFKCDHNELDHVICVHDAGICQVTSPLAVIPSHHLEPEDVQFMIALVHRDNVAMGQCTHRVHYTEVLTLLDYLGGDMCIIETLFTHVHKLAAETLDVRIAFEIDRMFQTNRHPGVVATAEYYNLYKQRHVDYWTPLLDKPLQTAMDLIRQLNPLAIVVPRDDSKYEITDAATILNVPESLLQLVNENSALVTIAGGAALAVRHRQTPSLLLPSSDVDIFLFDAANKNPVVLMKFVQCLRDNQYVVCRSRTCVLTAIHAVFRTVQLIGCEARDGLALVSTFDFWNIQIYYDGARCYETVQAAYANASMTLKIDANTRLESISTCRIRKMLLKGFSKDDTKWQQHLDTNQSSDDEVIYDHGLLFDPQHSHMHTNIFHQIGLTPIGQDKPLEPLTSVPTYQKNLRYWIDDGTPDALDRLDARITDIRTIRTGVYSVDGLSIDLGFGQMPQYVNHQSMDVSTEEDACAHLLDNINQLETTDKSTYLRFCDIRARIIDRVADHAATTSDRKRSDSKFNDIDIQLTKRTAFYLDGKQVESYTTILAMLASNRYMYHAYSAFSYVSTYCDAQCTFVVEKIIITRRPGDFRA